MGVSVVPLLGVVFLGGAMMLSLASTLSSSWLSLSSDLLPAEVFQLGLWGACVVQDPGPTECRPHSGLLALPGRLLLARLLMCASLGGGLLALLLTLPGLLRDPSRYQRALRGTGGALNLGSGVLILVPVSLVAHEAVQSYLDPSLSDSAPRWELGDALFLGWTAAVLHLTAGVLLLISCNQGHQGPGPQGSQRPQGPGHHRAGPVHIHLDLLEPGRLNTRTEYV